MGKMEYAASWTYISLRSQKNIEKRQHQLSQGITTIKSRMHFNIVFVWIWNEHCLFSAHKPSSNKIGNECSHDHISRREPHECEAKKKKIKKRPLAVQSEARARKKLKSSFLAIICRQKQCNAKVAADYILPLPVHV